MDWDDDFSMLSSLNFLEKIEATSKGLPDHNPLDFAAALKTLDKPLVHRYRTIILPYLTEVLPRNLPLYNDDPAYLISALHVARIKRK